MLLRHHQKIRQRRQDCRHSVCLQIMQLQWLPKPKSIQSIYSLGVWLFCSNIALQDKHTIDQFNISNYQIWLCANILHSIYNILDLFCLFWTHAPKHSDPDCHDPTQCLKPVCCQGSPLGPWCNRTHRRRQMVCSRDNMSKIYWWVNRHNHKQDYNTKTSKLHKQNKKCSTSNANSKG